MNIKATILQFQQGTPEWAQHRSRALNASELAVAMGISSNMQRNELVKRMATGIQIEHSDFVEQRVFAPGHRFEAMARPWAEEIIGEDLYCSTFSADVDGLERPVSASLDGHTLLNETNFEHKQLNDELEASLDAGVIPDEFHPQMEQGLMLTGATRCLFMASKGTRESLRFCWYESNPELRAKIIPTWKQLMADVAAYKPSAAEPIKPVGRTPDQLPALRASVTGELVLEANIKEWEAAALVYIQEVRNHELKTDQDFEDADAAVKWCVSSKTTLDGLKSNLMSATGDVNTAVGTLDRLMSELDKTRIQFTKAMDARKAERKAEIVAGGVAEFAKYVRDLNAAMPSPYMPAIPVDFGGCIRNLRSFASIQNAVDTELASAKVRAADMANRIHTNIAALRDAGIGMPPDLATLVIKAPDDFAAVIAQRKAAEQARLDAERERIRAEEASKLQREAEAKAAAEKAEAERLERQRQAVAAAASMPAPAVQTYDNGAPMTKLTAVPEAGSQIVTATPVLSDKAVVDRNAIEFIDRIEGVADDGAHLTLGQLNAAIAPVSIDVAGLATLGFEPVEKVKASRLYRACDLPAICEALIRHLHNVAEAVTA